MIRRKPDREEIATFTMVFYVLAAVVVVFLLAVMPSVVELLVSP